MKPKISVIVPVYNTEKYLDRCIQSILAQTYTNFELLLIDDGSTDSSGAICDRYAEQDSRVRVFHKENNGASSARNVGLDNVRGEFVGFVDADDYVSLEFLSNFISICNGADLLIQGIIPDYSISNDYIITHASVDYRGNIQDGLKLLYKCPMSGSLCNKLFKSSKIVAHKLRLNTSFTFKEDEDFLLKYMSFVNTLSSTIKSGYIYVIADWSKYSTSYNLPVIMSMYNSVVRIYDGKANKVTDFYQSLLYQEWIAELRANYCRAIQFLPKIFPIVSWRIFRLTPIKKTLNKIIKFINKG